MSEKWYERDYGEAGEDLMHKKSYLRRRGIQWKPKTQPISEEIQREDPKIKKMYEELAHTRQELAKMKKKKKPKKAKKKRRRYVDAAVGGFRFLAEQGRRQAEEADRHWGW